MIVIEDKAKRDAAYAAHAREQQEYWDTVPFSEKLRWLEEMHHVVLHLNSQRETKNQQRENRS